MINTLNSYYNDGWLIKQYHPTLPLIIWNYSQTTQYEGKWDDITIMCRGLVTDFEGNIIARPFRKFFNIEENRHTPTAEFDVYEKLDGSLGIFFYYKGEPIFASRGSFTSEQAIRGRQLLDKYNWQYGTYEGYTYLFEIIYPENRVVVDYGKIEDLVVLGVIETATGKECKFHEMYNEGFKLVKKYNGISDYSKLKDIIGNNEEGYVIRFSNGERVKIKGNEYIRLHKIMMQLSTKSIWEFLSNNSNMEELLINVPDEFYSKIKEYEIFLKNQFNEIYNNCYRHFNLIKKSTTNRKEFAQMAQEFKYPHVLFFMLDYKNVSSIIWKIIQPKTEKIL